jgi:hypothetical protein
VGLVGWSCEVSRWSVGLMGGQWSWWVVKGRLVGWWVVVMVKSELVGCWGLW